MNNQPKIEAFKSFYQQGKDLYNTGDINQKLIWYKQRKGRKKKTPFFGVFSVNGQTCGQTTKLNEKCKRKKS